MHRCLAILAMHANKMAEAGNSGEGGEAVPAPSVDGGGQQYRAMKKEEELQPWRKTGSLGVAGTRYEERKVTANAPCSGRQSPDPTLEAEEEEASWMEKRICLIILTQLLLHIENQLHTLANVHTAAWHLQQHQEWQKEVSALAGGPRVLCHFPLSFPSTSGGVPLSPPSQRGGAEADHGSSESKSGTHEDPSNVENEGEGSTRPSAPEAGGRRTRGEGRDEEASRKRRRSVPSDGEGLAGGSGVSVSSRSREVSGRGMVAENEAEEEEEQKQEEEEDGAEFHEEGRREVERETGDSGDSEMKTGEAESLAADRREPLAPREGVEGRREKEEEWDENEKEEVKQPRLDWCSRDGEDDEKEERMVEVAGSLSESREEDSSPFVKSEPLQESPTASNKPSHAPQSTAGGEGCSSADLPPVHPLEQQRDLQRETSEGRSNTGLSEASRPVLLRLSPSSPLRRVQTLAESIGWSFSKTLAVLRRVRAKEARHLQRLQRRDQERRSLKASFEDPLHSPAPPASAAVSSSPSSSSFAAAPSPSWAEGEQDRPVSWATVRNRADVLAVWGLYANAWKAFGLDKHKLMDVQLSVDRNVFLSLLAHDEQKAGLPDLGDRLFYFRKGHEQSMISMQQEYVEALDTKSWLDSTSIPLSIPFELGRVEELVVEAISYHPGVAAAPPPSSSTPPSSTSLLSALPSGLSDAAHELLLDLPDQLFSFSIVDDPSFLGLVPLDSSTHGGRPGGGLGGTMTGHRKLLHFGQACKRENGGVSSTPNSGVCQTHLTAGLPGEGLGTTAATPAGCSGRPPGLDNDEAAGSLLSTEETGGGHSQASLLLPALPGSSPGASTSSLGGGGKSGLTVRTPCGVFDRFKVANSNMGLLSGSAGGVCLTSSSMQGCGVGHGAGDLSGWMSGEGSLTPLMSNGEGMPVGLLGRPEVDIFTSADPLAVAAHTAARAKASLLRQQQDDAGESGDGDRGTPPVTVETAPYYRMVCRVIRREHETTADALSERIKSIVTAAASEDKPHTRTSSRLLNYQSRIGVSRSTLSTYLRNRQAQSSQKVGGRGGGHLLPPVEPSGGEEEDECAGNLHQLGGAPSSSSSSLASSLPSSSTPSNGAGGGGGGGGVLAGGVPEVRFEHVTGPQGERQVVLCVPVRADDIEFVVRKDRVLQALNLGWNVGMKFRMLFHTAGGVACGDAGGSGGAGSGGSTSSSSSSSTGKESGGTGAGGGGGGSAGGEGGSSSSTSGSSSGLSVSGSGNSSKYPGGSVGGSHTTRYTGTVRKVDLLHPDFWENVLVEWEDKKHGGGSNSSSSSGSGSGGGSSSSSGGSANSNGKSGTPQQQKGDPDGSMEGVSLWELEPLKRLKRPGAGD